MANILAGHGAPIIDTDELARQLISPGTPGHDAVLHHFGPKVAGEGGNLDRRALASLVFSDPAQLAQLEAITHPLVGQELERRLAGLEGAPLVVVQIPLLDQERRKRYHIDRVVLVTAAPDLALSRGMARGFSAADVRGRQAAQPADAERRALADWVVENDGNLAQLEAQVGRLWTLLADQADQADQAALAAPLPPAESP